MKSLDETRFLKLSQDDVDILGKPFAEKYTMARSSTMPLDEAGSKGATTPTMGFASPSLAMSLSSIKSLTKTGQSRLSSLKKSGYFGGWSTLSPSSKKAQEALTTIKSAYSTAATSLSKRVEEFREYQTPQKSMSPAVSSQYLNSGRDEDALSQDSNGSRRVSDVTGLPPIDNNTETWSYFSGQIWEQIWSGYYSYAGDGVSKTDAPPTNSSTGGKTITELFEDVYSKMPRRPPGPVAMELHMTSCSRCLYCGCIVYDEEIMAGWTAEDSNLNTKCHFCNRWFVPFLTIRVIDFRTRPLSAMANLLTPAPSVDSLSVTGSVLSLQRSACKSEVGSALSLNQQPPPSKRIEESEPSSRHATSHNRSASEGNASMSTNSSDDDAESAASQHQKNHLDDPIISEPITVPYLSPLVLRKELENLLEREGDICLVNPDCVDDHPIIYWNLVWYFERIAVKSQIPGICLKAKSLNNENSDNPLVAIRTHNASSWASADHRNVHIQCKWDNERLHDEQQPPIYTQWHSVDLCDSEMTANPNWIAKMLSHQDHSSLRPLMEQIISGVQHNDLLQVTF